MAVEQTSKMDALSAVDYSVTSVTCLPGSGSTTVALTFSQFKAHKEKDRKAYFHSKGTAKKATYNLGQNEWNISTTPPPPPPISMMLKWLVLVFARLHRCFGGEGG